MGSKNTCDTTSTNTKSSKSSPTLKKESLVRDKFALLAMVGRRKREALAYHEAEEFYSTIVSEQHANLAALLSSLRPLAERSPALAELLSFHTSRLHHSTKKLLSYWPKNTASQETLWNLLASEELSQTLATTPDGYVSLSTDQILDNVVLAIGATQEELQRH